MSSDDEVEILEDEDLQRALALSLQDVVGGGNGGGGAAPPAAQQPPEQQQQQEEPAQKRPARQPMRGKRKQPDPPPAGQQPAGERGSDAGQGQPPRRPAGPPSASRPAAGGKAAGGGGAGGAQQRQGRKKKLPAFNPSDAEVEECFKVLAGGGNMVTVGAMVEVSQATGGDLKLPGAQQMMAYAAENVLGWGSSAGRAQGAKGALGLPAFRQLIDHFRVTG